MKAIKKIVNLQRRFFLSLRYGSKIRIDSIPLGHFLPKIHVSDSGKINIGMDLMAEKNTSVESYGSGFVSVGDHVFMNTNTKIVSREHIEIGDRTVIGPNVCIYDHDHNWKSEHMQEEYVTAPVIIGPDVWIGANCIILKGTTIGEHSVIAAGSVVKGTIPAGVLFYQERHNVIREK